MEVAIRYLAMNVVHCNKSTLSAASPTDTKVSLSIPGLNRINALMVKIPTTSVVAPVSEEQRGYTKQRQIAPRPEYIPQK